MSVRGASFDASSLPPHVPGALLTVGTFDGVHRGHIDVLARLVARAGAVGAPAMLVTFEPHPLQVLHPESAPRLLTTHDEKVAALATTGLDYMAILAFTHRLAARSAERFVDEVLLDRFRMRELFVGHDHGFGRGREGDVETLRMLGAARGFGVHVVPPVRLRTGEVVSSSLVRKAIEAGDLEEAQTALGRMYGLAGRVVHGDARGRTLGFPTLNVATGSPRKLLPPDGVYAVDVATPRGRFGGMVNLGGRPTFGDDRRTIEAHLFDASGDFYDDPVHIGFVRRLRDVVSFPSADALRAQLVEDERAARRALTSSGGAGTLSGSTPASPSTL